MHVCIFLRIRRWKCYWGNCQSMFDSNLEIRDFLLKSNILWKVFFLSMENIRNLVEIERIQFERCRFSRGSSFFPKMFTSYTRELLTQMKKALDFSFKSLSTLIYMCITKKDSNAMFSNVFKRLQTVSADNITFQSVHSIGSYLI